MAFYRYTNSGRCHKASFSDIKRAFFNRGWEIHDYGRLSLRNHVLSFEQVEEITPEERHQWSQQVDSLLKILSAH